MQTFVKIATPDLGTTGSSIMSTHTYMYVYLKATIIMSTFAIFATGGKTAKLSTGNYLIMCHEIIMNNTQSNYRNKYS